MPREGVAMLSGAAVNDIVKRNQKENLVPRASCANGEQIYVKKQRKQPLASY